MTTAPPTPTMATGRRRTAAVSTQSVGRWDDAAACRTHPSDLFTSDDRDDNMQARRVCLGCPILETCLSRQMRTEEVLYRWNLVGGLTPQQRRALYGELVLGGRPNWKVAARLARPQGWYRLMAAWKESGRRLPQTTVLLRAEGWLVDETTVRVALWWAGEVVSRLTSPPSGSSAERAERMAAEDGEAIRRLLEAGVAYNDVVAYFGARRATTVNAIRVLEKQAVAA
ncbi:WhiB family transcriptional regulator [Streptomyces sp. NPDC054847]